MIKLNANEQRIVNALCRNNSCGADSKEDLKLDNMTWFNQICIQKLGFSKHEAAGYMADLEKKGMIFNCDPTERYGWSVTDDGIDASDLLD